MSLAAIAKEMVEVAKGNPHDYLKNLLVPEPCARKLLYNGQEVSVVFSLDVFREVGGAAYHLTVTPGIRALTPAEVREFLEAFFGAAGPVTEITEGVRASFGHYIPSQQRQFIQPLS